MYLRLLPACSAWAFLTGDSIVRIDGEPMLFRSRAEAETAAHRKLLTVARNGHVRAL